MFTYSDPLYFHPIFTHIMSGRRFKQTLRCLSISSMGSQNLDKIKPMMDILIRNFQSAFSPKCELSLDESLLLFRGRLHFRQYIKEQKTKYGIKFYELASSDGYILNIELYSGKSAPVDSSASKTEQIVFRLMQSYLTKGHTLFMDNYYNSVTLSEKLLNYKTHSVGTLRSSRKRNPKQLTGKNLKKGEHCWVRLKKVYISKWKDRREVLMITTKNHPELIQVKNRYGQIRIKPKEIAIYNEHMSGIDRADQMTSYYSSPRKTIRWYKKVLFYLLDVATWNEFFLHKNYCKNGDKHYKFLHFREDLIRSLTSIGPEVKGKHLLIPRNIHDNRKTPATMTQAEAIPSSSGKGGHWPERNPLLPNRTRKTTFLKCRMCTKKKLRKETSYRCKTCPEKPPLCPDCFEEWHSKEGQVPN